MQLSLPLAQNFQHVRSALLLGYPAMHALPSVLHDARYVSESASEMRGLPGAAAGGLVVRNVLVVVGLRYGNAVASVTEAAGLS